MDTVIKLRKDQADYLTFKDESGTETTEFLGTGITELDEEPNAVTTEKQYINQSSKSKDITGYEPTAPFNGDQILSEPAIKHIVNIGKYRKVGVDAEAEYTRVDLDEPIDSKENTFNARRSRVSIEVTSLPTEDGQKRLEGNFNDKEDVIRGEFNTQTKTFTPTVEVTP